MQQHGSKYLRPDTLDPGVGSTFSECGHVAYQIKANHEMQQLVSKYFARRPPSPTQEMESLGLNSTFSEHGHVTIKFKRITNAATW